MFSNYAFRRNKIEGCDLSRSYIEYTSASKSIIDELVVKLVEVEFGLVRFGMEKVESDLERLIQYKSDFENTRVCGVCLKRNPKSSRACECGSSDLYSLKPDCPFKATTTGSTISVAKKYRPYETVVKRFDIPEATIFLDSVIECNPNNFEQISYIMSQVSNPEECALVLQFLEFCCVDGLILIQLQAKYELCVPVVAFGHTDFSWLTIIRRILMLFFGKEYELVINVKTDRAKQWLRSSKDYSAFKILLTFSLTFARVPAHLRSPNFFIGIDVFGQNTRFLRP